MISNEQIAHDLAISKLHGSDASMQELIKQYRQYKNEILNILEPAKESSIKHSPY